MDRRLIAALPLPLTRTAIRPDCLHFIINEDIGPDQAAKAALPDGLAPTLAPQLPRRSASKIIDKEWISNCIGLVGCNGIQVCGHHIKAKLIPAMEPGDVDGTEELVR